MGKIVMEEIKSEPEHEMMETLHFRINKWGSPVITKISWIKSMYLIFKVITGSVLFTNTGFQGQEKMGKSQAYFHFTIKLKFYTEFTT